MSNDVTTAGLRDNARVLRWLLGHTGELKSLLALYDALLQAEGIVDKWTVVKGAGDILVGIIDSYPAADADSIVALADLQATAAATGIDWGKLAGFAEKLLPLVLELVLKLRG